MKHFSRAVFATAAVVLCLTLAGFAEDSNNQNSRLPLQVNQTEGFAEGQVLVFTYFQNFDCIHQPFDDLDHNGLVAAVDPAEFQKPICVVGHRPTLDPSGTSIQNTQKLYVISPFFGNSKDVNDAFNPTLGQALLSLFGFIPEAFKTHPDVPVQCPEPGPPTTTHTGMPGTCTMHAMNIDLGPVLAAQGKVPPGTSVVVPTLNHSHIIGEKDFGAVWWEVISVLVTDPSAWPSADGRSGINSLDALRAAQAAGKAARDQPTNFFLFFNSQPESH